MSDYGKVTLLFFVTLAAFIAGHANGYSNAMQTQMPRLIGYDCEGTSGDIWAMEESDFPMCREIEAAY